MPPPLLAELEAIVELVMVTEDRAKIPPPLLVAVFPLMVELSIVIVPPPLLDSPAPLLAVFPEIVTRFRIIGLAVSIPPPWAVAVLPVTATSCKVRLTPLPNSMPPPLEAAPF